MKQQIEKTILNLLDNNIIAWIVRIIILSMPIFGWSIASILASYI